MPSLPRDELLARLEREIAAVRREGPHLLRRPRSAPGTLPLVMEGALLDTPGPVWDGKALVHEHVHRFELTVGEEHPYVKPVVRWLTPIFHPNIMMPEEGGLVCTRLLTEWRFDNTLADFLQQLAKLVSAPDVKNGFATPASAAASQYFAKEPYRPPPRLDG